MTMKKEEYFSEYQRLKNEIERNESIHCFRVAAKYRRYLDKLVERWNKETDLCNNERSSYGTENDS